MSEISSQHKAAIEKLLKQGKKMQAIKYARNAFNISLKDSVRLVNSVDQELHPERKIDIDSLPATGGPPKIFYYTFGAVGGLLVAGASIMFYFDQQAVSHSMKARGEVVDFHYDEGAASPIVAYEWEGDEYTHYSSTFSDPPSYDIGEQVEMYVNPSDPTDAMINTFSDRFLGIVIVGGLGCFFLGFLFMFDRIFTRRTL